ncbi:response regulator [Bradyrhizobium manausense]|uniref:response regulator transcription factor n=1 Tax=Bradyrhizobium manausense TaxID=989370 RepID=UPI000B3063A9
MIREFVVEALREAGYHVIHASNGEEALAWCKRRVADVLVTDVTLPGQIDGWQIAERYREQDPGLPVIYATGFSPTTPRPVPGSRIVKKPFNPEELVRTIRENPREEWRIDCLVSLCAANLLIRDMDGKKGDPSVLRLAARRDKAGVAAQ